MERVTLLPQVRVLASSGHRKTAPVGVGRARATVALRQWGRALQERQGEREAGALAMVFRNHVLLLRCFEAWKVAVESIRAEVVVEAKVIALSRRARMRRALLGIASGAEVAAAEREAALPRLREVFEAWEAFVRVLAEKKARHDCEERERLRWSSISVAKLFSGARTVFIRVSTPTGLRAELRPFRSRFLCFRNLRCEKS